MESETISEASADGNTELTLDDMADAVAVVKAKTLTNTLADVTAEALVRALAVWPEEVEPENQSKKWLM